MPGKVVRFENPNNDPAFKIPHMGWNQVRSTKANDAMLEGFQTDRISICPQLLRCARRSACRMADFRLWSSILSASAFRKRDGDPVSSREKSKGRVRLLSTS